MDTFIWYEYLDLKSTGLSKIILVKGGYGFSNNCRGIYFNHFLNVKICQTVLFFIFFPPFAVMPKDFYACLTNYVGVLHETGSVTLKKMLVGQSFVAKKSSHEIG
jgi:hypothetical protein